MTLSSACGASGMSHEKQLTLEPHAKYHRSVMYKYSHDLHEKLSQHNQLITRLDLSHSSWTSTFSCICLKGDPLLISFTWDNNLTIASEESLSPSLVMIVITFTHSLTLGLINYIDRPSSEWMIAREGESKRWELYYSNIWCITEHILIVHWTRFMSHRYERESKVSCYTGESQMSALTGEQDKTVFQPN